ncbi:MAG: hypothetical protein HS116_21935 [Planctomycetes bacterium]|nr:hypothetical protein [Planctomycetota bacterium]
MELHGAMESQRSPDSRKQERVAAPANWARWPRRVAVYATGTAIVVAGIVILPLPGPMGTPIILIGLTVLARESPRAERIRARMVEALRLKQLAEARPKRFRLHLSTVVALTVTAGALIGANAVPIERQEEADSPWLAIEDARKRNGIRCQTQGWPWAYRVGDVPVGADAEEGGHSDLLPAISNPAAQPNVSVRRLVLSPISSQAINESLNRWLLQNVLVGLAILTLVAWSLEWWARWRAAVRT